MQAKILGSMTTQTPFRVLANRQKYLLFVDTCSEKREPAERIGEALDEVRPCPLTPPNEIVT